MFNVFVQKIYSKMSESNNFKNPVSGMDRYGKQRLELAVCLRDKVLKHLNIPYTLENGTLLGAYRNGKFIVHDDDFDFALFFESDPLPSLPNILNKIKQHLPDPYNARIVSSYANKIEVFDSSWGQYTLLGPKYRGASYHHVTADLQCYVRTGPVYKALYHIGVRDDFIPLTDVFPIGRIKLEGETFHAPGNTESFLKIVYGSLSPNAKYNMNTGKYEEPEDITSYI